MAKTTKADYSKIKIVAWRLGRAFLSGFLGTLAVSFSTVESLDKAILISLAGGALTGGLQALGKALREFLGDPKYKSLIYKLPL